MARRSKSNRAAKIITYIFLVLLLIAVFGSVAYLTDFGQSDIKTFSLTIGDRVILRDEGDITISSGEKIFVNSANGYTVEVYANADESNFDFMYGEEQMQWSDCVSKELLCFADSGLNIRCDSDGLLSSMRICRA